MKKPKPLDEQFENEVWLLFAAMGFQYMNRDRHLEIPYSSSNPKLTKQIDVFAADEETVLFVECKCATSGRKASSKDELEQIRGNREGLFAEARRAFPNRKIRYILATKNYQVSAPDYDRMKEFGIHYYNEYEIRYFGELVKHLGKSAKYQLLGSLFEGQKLPQ